MLSIRARLMLGFGLMMFFIMGQSIVTFVYFQENSSLVRQAINHDFKASTEIANIAVIGQALRRYEKEYFIYVDNFDKRRGYHKEFSESAGKLKKSLDGILGDTSTTWSDDDKREATVWAKALDTYTLGFNEIADKVERGELQTTLEANAAIQNAKNAFRVLLKGAAKGSRLKYQGAEVNHARIAKNLNFVNYTVIVMSVAGLALVLVLMISIPRAIAGPIKLLNDAATAMSVGNLDRRVPLSSVAEFEDLAKTLERMRVSQKVLIHKSRFNDKDLMPEVNR